LGALRSRLPYVLAFQIIGLCLFSSYRFINLESTIILMIFDLFFVSIIFQLVGSAKKKICLLSLGNLLGLFWNLVFYYFSSAGILLLGHGFEIMYVMFYPFLNLVWMVTFWSLSLAALSRKDNTILEAKE
jgi:hypothetical protein